MSVTSIIDVTLRIIQDNLSLFCKESCPEDIFRLLSTGISNILKERQKVAKLIEKIKTDMLKARKENLIIKDVIRVLYSEIELSQNRSKQSLESVEDSVVVKIISKLIDSNKECLNHYSKKYLSLEETQKPSKLKDEIIYLSDLLPKTISADEIKTIINENEELKDKINNADNKNKVIGDVISYFKIKNISIDPKEVSNIIRNWN